jgi:hypothetical protein
MLTLEQYEKGLIDMLDAENFDTYNPNDDTTDQIENEPSDDQYLQKQVDILKGQNELLEDE